MTSSPTASDVTTPVVDLERIEITYAELKKMEIRLDPNPIDYGPKRFNNRIAKVRSMLTRLEQIFLQTSEDLHYFQRLISKLTALYELEKRDLMINDPKCRMGRSQGEREALADVQLRGDIEKLQTLQLAASDLEAMMVVIKSKRTDLKDIQGRMRDQMKLIEHDLGMGARWGRNSPPSDVNHLQDIDDLLVSVDQEAGVSDDEDAPLSSSPEEEESIEEAEEPVEAVDANHDPAPHAEPEPVLLFGEEEASKASEVLENESASSNGEDAIIPNEDDEGTVPEEHVAQQDADSFLDSLSSAGEDEGSADSSDEQEEQKIDDLIASLSDD